LSHTNHKLTVDEEKNSFFFFFFCVALKQKMASTTTKDDDVDNRQEQQQQQSNVNTNTTNQINASEADPLWLTPLLASPPRATSERMFVRFEHAESHIVARQHLSTLLVLHLAPTYPALSRGDDVRVVEVKFHAEPSLTTNASHRKRSLHQKKDAAAAEDGAILICSVRTSDDAQFEIRVNLFGQVRDTNPLLADGSLQLSRANCDSSAYLALFLPTTRCHRDFSEGKLGWVKQS
jgi:hypothetical protein